MKGILKLAVFGIAAIAAFSSCSKNEDVPSQKDIETKIIGKWKDIKIDGVDVPTNNKIVQTFETDGSVTQSISRIMFGEHIWTKQLKGIYEVNNSEISLKFSNEQTILTSAVQDINSSSFSWKNFSCIVNGRKLEYEPLIETYQKVTADYSQDIIGMWEGVEMTGDETYGDANHRIYYKEDGTYTYYDKVGDSWVPSKNAGNEYNVDGDWLATRWQPTEGADYEYEWWDIVEIKDGTMKWSALREKGDKTRYTTTFTWKKVNLPTQEEIETKIIGRWKKMKHDGKDAVTNKRKIWTFNNDGKGTQSTADYKEGEKTFIWDNKEPIQYSIQGNILHSISTDVEQTAAIPFINANQMTMHVTKIKIISRGVDVKYSYVGEYSKVTADYSQDIIGMWEGVEMTGDETYGDANHRIYYKEDGTYTYYDKVGDSWVPSKNAGNEYNVDGDWLATRWQPTEGADYEYEWWDIDEIKDGTMKWSALREKGDGTRYTTTFTWKKVNLPTQEEIESKIIGKWKTTTLDGKDILTNNRIIRTFTSNHKVTHSTSHYSDGTYLWFNKIPLQYDVVGNELHEISEETSMKVLSKILSIDETQFFINIFKIIFPDSKELSNTNSGFHKVTADYSQDIIGMWEGVEMTGDETYGDANHRIEYKADGTYTYYDKVGDNWVPSDNVDNEYNIDGDWLATRWRPTAGADYEYEWWDIDEIKDGTMKWSALREKEDGTRYTTTFTWKKIQLQ